MSVVGIGMLGMVLPVGPTRGGILIIEGGDVNNMVELTIGVGLVTLVFGVLWWSSDRKLNRVGLPVGWGVYTALAAGGHV